MKRAPRRRPRSHFVPLALAACAAASISVALGQQPSTSSGPTSLTERLPQATNSGYVPREFGPVIVVTEADKKGHDLMLRVLEATRQRVSRSSVYYGSDGVALAQQATAVAFSPADRIGTNLRLMLAQLEHGDELDALKQLDVVRKLEREIGEQTMGPSAVAELAFRYALVHLRYGETQNCCLDRNEDSCLLPIKGGGVHKKQEGSRAAIDELKRVAELAEPGSDLYLDAVWLWNIAAMTVGEYPDGVPAEHRLPPESFKSKEAFPRFYNVSVELGLNTDSMCGGTIAEDFNNDGYLDLMVSSWDVRLPLKLFVNDGAGGFVERGSAAGLDGICGGLNMVQGDYNNDGRVDVYILRGAWQGASGRITGSLLRNNGDGTFTDVTFPAGISEESYPGQSAGWADYDLDGWLDLYVVGEEGPDTRAPCRLFHNNQDGTFTDVALEAGVTTHQFSKGCAWGDYNSDRYPDLYVSNFGTFDSNGSDQRGGINRLYRNNGDGTFTDVAAEAGVSSDTPTFGTWFWDYNNDGVLDLYVSRYASSTADVARFYRGETPKQLSTPRVLRGTPEGKFVEMTDELGFKEPTLPMGSNFGDLDNDGWLDMYLGTGSPDFQMVLPNKLYHNIGGKRFSDVSEAAGMAHLQKGHGVAFADFDADGDQDIFEQMGGAFAVDKYTDSLFENPGFGNNAVSVELVGVESNRMGVGSRIRVEVEEGGQTRSIYKWVNSGGSFGCNSLRQQIGVGKATRVKRLEVYWPKSDTTQVFEDLPVGGIVRVTEGSSQLVQMTLRPLEFARPKPKLTVTNIPLAPGE